MIAIVDYGVGNLRSVERALLHVGATPKLTADQDELQHADGMVLPGVGAFAPALEKLSDGGLGRRVVELARKGKPVLGVCLGYQLLFEESMENGRHQGRVPQRDRVHRTIAGRGRCSPQRDGDPVPSREERSGRLARLRELRGPLRLRNPCLPNA